MQARLYLEDEMHEEKEEITEEIGDTTSKEASAPK